MAYGHSSGLPPWEAPVMIAEKRFPLLLLLLLLSRTYLMWFILTAESFGGQPEHVMHCNMWQCSCMHLGL